jgi:hypothetical protein
MVVRHRCLGDRGPARWSLAGAGDRGGVEHGGAHDDPLLRQLPRCVAKNVKTLFQPSMACSCRYMGVW